MDAVRDLLITLGAVAGVVILFNILFILSLYWAHHPYGRRERRKRWRGK